MIQWRQCHFLSLLLQYYKYTCDVGADNREFIYENHKVRCYLVVSVTVCIWVEFPMTKMWALTCSISINLIKTDFVKLCVIMWNWPLLHVQHHDQVWHCKTWLRHSLTFCDNVWHFCDTTTTWHILMILVTCAIVRHYVTQRMTFYDVDIMWHWLTSVVTGIFWTTPPTTIVL